MTAPDFPRGNSGQGGSMFGTIGRLNPAEAGPLIAPYIPMRKQSHVKGALNPVGTVVDPRIERAFTNWDQTTGIPGFDTGQDGFVHDAGDTLLDYTDPAKPTVLEAGNYELMLWADWDTSGAGSQVGKIVYLKLNVFKGSPYGSIGLNQDGHLIGLASGFSQPATCSLATYLDPAAGDYFEVVISADGTPTIKGDQLFVWAKPI